MEIEFKIGKIGRANAYSLFMISLDWLRDIKIGTFHLSLLEYGIEITCHLK
jgi:hypothetical protein